MSISLPITFTARVTSGKGRGRRIGFPTINCNLENVPDEVEEGIYAGNVSLVEESIVNGQQSTVMRAAIHYGPKPSYKEESSFEVHIIDEHRGINPESLTIELVARLRDIQDFSEEEDLKEQIRMDIAQASDILSGQ